MERTDFDAIFRGFENAFADYEIHFDKEEVRSMLTRRGYAPCLSFAAFEGEEIVAFTLNGIGMFNGIPTAYDTGTGTSAGCRGRGLAGKIFTHSLPYLKAAGIGQYLLEVLQNNRKAIGVYRGMGFQTVREFDCFRQKISEICSRPAAVRTDADIRIEPIDVDAVRRVQSYADFCPSWQNSMESIERGRACLTCIGAFCTETPVGYCVFDRETGDLTQIAVKNEYRRKGIATQLLRQAASQMTTGFIKVLNIPTDDTALHQFLHSNGIPLMNKQFEMALPL